MLILWTTAPPTPPAVCDVKPGTPVFFFALGGECSSAEPPPFFGATEQEQRECTLGFLRATAFDAILVSIDGGPPVNIGLDRFIAVSGVPLPSRRSRPRSPTSSPRSRRNC